MAAAGAADAEAAEVSPRARMTGAGPKRRRINVKLECEGVRLADVQCRAKSEETVGDVKKQLQKKVVKRMKLDETAAFTIVLNQNGFEIDSGVFTGVASALFLAVAGGQGRGSGRGLG